MRSIQESFVNVNGKYASSIISPLLAGAVKRRTNVVRARATPHVQLWVFSKHLQKKCLTLNVIFSIILFMAYGIRINNNSNNEIFGYNTTASHFITQGSSTISKNNSVTHNCEGMEANNADTVGVIVISTNNFDSEKITIDRAPSGNNGTFRINYGNGVAASIAVTFYCFRY